MRRSDLIGLAVGVGIALAGAIAYGVGELQVARCEGGPESPSMCGYARLPATTVAFLLWAASALTLLAFGFFALVDAVGRRRQRGRKPEP